jgi:hypothetical protein
VLRVAGVLAFVGVQLALRAATRLPPPARAYGVGYRTVVVAVEVVALLRGLQVLSRVFDAPEAGVAWVTVIVGLHCNALAVVWRETSFHVLGAALTAFGATGLLLAATGAGEAASATVGGVLPGLLLLTGGRWAAAQSGRVPQQAPRARPDRSVDHGVVAQHPRSAQPRERATTP